MQNSVGIEINHRFFAAIDYLIIIGKLRGQKSFATIYHVNWGNLYRLRREPQREFNMAFLNYIVTDFGVSAQWLLTGHGAMMEALNN
jgi:hypothetical protein